MATRILISDDGNTQLWQVTDDLGNVTTDSVPWATVNEATIRTQAATALTDNRTFLAIASPTTAQTLAQVKALTRQNNGIIRLLLGQLDGTN